MCSRGVERSQILLIMQGTSGMQSQNTQRPGVHDIFGITTPIVQVKQLSSAQFFCLKLVVAHLLESRKGPSLESF